MGVVCGWLQLPCPSCIGDFLFNVGWKHFFSSFRTGVQIFAWRSGSLVEYIMYYYYSRFASIKDLFEIAEILTLLLLHSSCIYSMGGENFEQTCILFYPMTAISLRVFPPFLALWDMEEIYVVFHVKKYLNSEYIYFDTFTPTSNCSYYQWIVLGIVLGTGPVSLIPV